MRSWLTTIVSRKATDRLRSRRPTEQITDDAVIVTNDPERAAVTSSQLEALSKVLRTLPDDLRIVWILREVSGHTYDEIADEVGESVATVRGRLSRARRTVLERMEEWR